MNKFTEILLVVLLCLAIPLTAAATELTNCTVTADTVTCAPGGTVAVAVRIGDNPGFTNFSIALDYDREHLTLISMETTDGNVPWLCGSDVSINKEYGCVVAASAEPVKDSGILFTATFAVDPGFTGEAAITPVVEYIRNNETVFSVFAQVHAAVIPGAVRSVLAGDVNGDGIIEYNDVMLAFRAFLGEAELTPEQMAAVDGNGNGDVDEEEYQAIYQIYIGGSR